MTKGTKNAERIVYVNNVPSSIDTVSGETVSIAAGAAGTVKLCQLAYRPVLDALGTDVGGFGDTSLVLTSTTFTTEVAPKDDSDLANGEYWVDYSLGRIRGKKADTGTSMTASYSTLQINITSLGTLGDVTIAEFPTAAALADGSANPTTTTVGSHMQGFNGTTWDRIRAGISAVVSSVTGWLNVLSGGVYNASPSTLTEGQFAITRIDSKGSNRVAEQNQPVAEDNTANYGIIGTLRKLVLGPTYAGTKYQNNSFTTTNVVAAAANVGRINIFNTTASPRYFQIHNSTAGASGGATAYEFWLIPANSQVILGMNELGEGGMPLSTGFTIANSSTASTYTAGSAGDLLVNLNYKS